MIPAIQNGQPNTNAYIVGTIRRRESPKQARSFLAHKVAGAVIPGPNRRLKIAFIAGKSLRIGHRRGIKNFAIRNAITLTGIERSIDTHESTLFLGY
jgi:hypothetical protein